MIYSFSEGVWMDIGKIITAIKQNKNKWFLRGFVIVLFVCVILSLYSDFKKDDFVVCIDAGHGGSSIGAVYGNDERLEKDDNLKLSLLVKDELEKQGASVILTRQSDKDVSLEKRCRIANFGRADYFLCIHRNSSENSDANGIEIWVSNTATDDELNTAQKLLENLSGKGLSVERGIKKGFRSGSGDYYINSKTNMPSCLLEIGFISNHEDNVAFDDNIEEYAKAIADAIIDSYEQK